MVPRKRPRCHGGFPVTGRGDGSSDLVHHLSAAAEGVRLNARLLQHADVEIAEVADEGAVKGVEVAFRDLPHRDEKAAELLQFGLLDDGDLLDLG
jgi:hypothetical protein